MRFENKLILWIWRELHNLLGNDPQHLERWCSQLMYYSTPWPHNAMCDTCKQDVLQAL